MDRLAIPLLLPVAVTLVTALLIVAIGSLLLAISHEWGEAVAVAVALALGGAVLVGCALAARGGTEEHHPAH